MPLPEAENAARYTKTQCIFHSTGTKAGARANARYFAAAAVRVESTFIVDYDGEILQVLPAGARADANGTANRRAISVEVVGTADEPFTPEQVAACIAIGRWACAEHPIPRRLIPAEPLGGIGWHVMFGAPGPWTSVAGKVCPGKQRIAQVRQVIIPAVQATEAESPVPTVQEDDMELYRDGGDLVAFNMTGRRRLENAAELGYWRDSGRLPAKVTDLADDPRLAAVVALLPWTEAAR